MFFATFNAEKIRRASFDGFCEAKMRAVRASQNSVSSTSRCDKILPNAKNARGKPQERSRTQKPRRESRGNIPERQNRAGKAVGTLPNAENTPGKPWERSQTPKPHRGTLGNAPEERKYIGRSRGNAPETQKCTRTSRGNAFEDGKRVRKVTKVFFEARNRAGQAARAGSWGGRPKRCWKRVGVWGRERPRFRVEVSLFPKNSSPASKREDTPGRKKPPDFAALTRGKPRDFPAKSEPLEMHEDTVRACVLCSVFCVLCSVFCVQL